MERDEFVMELEKLIGMMRTYVVTGEAPLLFDMFESRDKLIKLYDGDELPVFEKRHGKIITDRQKEVIEMSAIGMTKGMISQKLGICQRTAMEHTAAPRKAIEEITGTYIPNVTALVAWCIVNGEIEVNFENR